MGWSGVLTANSAEQSSITFTSDTNDTGKYTVGSFTAPKKAVYEFKLYGSGGAYNGYHEDGVSASGGTGGLTTGYLLMEQGQTVYIGVGGTCSAAFVSKINAASLAATQSAVNLYFVAGAGGGGGANWGQQWNMKAGAGGSGGGTTGANGQTPEAWPNGGAGGTQSSGFAYGYGGGGGYSNSNDTSFHAGRGGDGYYGGQGGTGYNGGGGGSGYIHETSLTVGNKTYTNSTTQGAGSGNNTNGYAVVTYYAKAELPITYDNQIVMELYYNNQEVKSLYYNGTKIY